jgi:hypothetical protein
MQHRECLQKLVSSDALLLLEGSGPGAEAFYTGKIFEYMNTGRPILAVIPSKGAAAGLVRETGSGLVADYDDLVQVKNAVCELYTRWLGHEGAFEPDWGKVRKYERKALTGELAAIFDSIPSRPH